MHGTNDAMRKERHVTCLNDFTKIVSPSGLRNHFGHAAYVGPAMHGADRQHVTAKTRTATKVIPRSLFDSCTMDTGGKMHKRLLSTHGEQGDKVFKVT